MPEIVVNDLQKLDASIKNSPAILGYFTGPDCNVCKVIKPIIIELLEKKFPKMAFHTVDCDDLPQAASQFGVLSIPTVVLFFDGKETTRLVRNFSIGELEQSISRLYTMLFE